MRVFGPEAAMKKSYKLSWFYHNCPTLSKGVVPQPEVPLQAFPVLNKSRVDRNHSRYCVLQSRKKTSASAASSGAVLGQVCPPTLAFPSKLPPTWSVVRYYLLKDKRDAQSSRCDSRKKLIEGLHPLTDVNSEFQVNTDAKRRIYKSKLRYLSSTQLGYRDGATCTLMAYLKPVNSSRLFHSSSNLLKSDDITFEDNLSCTRECAASEDGFVSRNTKEITVGKEDTPSTAKSQCEDMKCRNNDSHSLNLNQDWPRTFEDKMSQKGNEKICSISANETVEERTSDCFVVSPYIEESGTRMDTPISSLELNKNDTVQEEKTIGKVLDDLDVVGTENGKHKSVRGKPPILPPGNELTADCNTLQERKTKKDKEKDEKVTGEEKIGSLSQKVVKEEMKWLKNPESMLFMERKPSFNEMEEHLRYGGMLKMVENIPSNVIDAAVKYGLKPMAEGYTCLITRCPKLSKQKRAKKGNLYINATSGHFQCDECQHRGTWSALQLNLEDMQKLKGKSRVDHPCMEAVQGAVPLKQGTSEVERYLNEGVLLKQLEKIELELVQEMFECYNLSLSTLMNYDIRYHHDDQALLLPYYLPDKTLISVKKLTCQSLEDIDSFEVSQEFMSTSGKSHLFGWNQISMKDKSVILTASEFDAMAITEVTKNKALALPMGISSTPIECLPDLERFTKILLWFENDLLSWKSAKAFARKLNGARCYIIRPSVENPGPYRALQQGLSVQKIINNAHQIMHESIIGYSDMKSEVYSELANLKLVAGTEWKRYKSLNTILKGHRRGELTVVTGPTGSGKTTFISEYSLDLCEAGVRTLWGSFEISNVKLAKVMLTQFAKKNLSTYIGEFDFWSKEFEQLPLFFMTFHGHQAIQRVIDAMTHAVYVHDIEHIVVDNLQFMMGVMDNDKFNMQDRIISSFRNFATTMNCHITVVIHPRKEKEEELCTASVFGSAKATQEADNILILQDRRKTNPRAGKYIQIVKNRFDGDLGKMMLKFDKETYTFANKEVDTEQISRKQYSQQDSTVKPTDGSDGQTMDTIYSQNQQDSEPWEANSPPDPAVKRFKNGSLFPAKDLDETEPGMNEGDNTMTYTSY